jgi:hypothetical protein
MTAVNPTDDYELFDSFFLAGAPSPGVCRFNFPKAVTGWENQAGKGEDGGESVLNGRKLSDFSVTITLWVGDYEVSHFDLWEAWKPILLTPVAVGAPRALDIYHPQLEGLGISSVIVKSWTEPQPNGDTSTVQIDFGQYAPSKRRSGSGKMNGSASGKTSAPGQAPTTPGAPVAPPDPNKALKDELDRRLEEYDSI